MKTNSMKFGTLATLLFAALSVSFVACSGDEYYYDNDDLTLAERTTRAGGEGLTQQFFWVNEGELPITLFRKHSMCTVTLTWTNGVALPYGIGQVPSLSYNPVVFESTRNKYNILRHENGNVTNIHFGYRNGNGDSIRLYANFYAIVYLKDQRDSVVMDTFDCKDVYRLSKYIPCSVHNSDPRQYHGEN